MENNNLIYWAWFFVIGGVIGWLAGYIVRGRGFGIPGDILIGVVGAAIGGWLASVFGVYAVSSFASFLIALAGAVVLVGLTRFIVRSV